VLGDKKEGFSLITYQPVTYHLPTITISFFFRTQFLQDGKIFKGCDVAGDSAPRGDLAQKTAHDFP
jgi:hypothetical protein